MRGFAGNAGGGELEASLAGSRAAMGTTHAKTIHVLRNKVKQHENSPSFGDSCFAAWWRVPVLREGH